MQKVLSSQTSLNVFMASKQTFFYYNKDWEFVVLTTSLTRDLAQQGFKLFKTSRHVILLMILISSFNRSKSLKNTLFYV